MTTQKTVTVEDVEKWFGSAARLAEAWAPDVTVCQRGERDLARLRDTAAQVPALVADNAALLATIQDVDAWLYNSGSFAAFACSGPNRCGRCRGCTAERLHVLAGADHPGSALLGMEAECGDAQADARRLETDVVRLQARVAELERDVAQRTEHGANLERVREGAWQALGFKTEPPTGFLHDAIASVVSERDALRAQVNRLRKAASTCLDWLDCERDEDLKARAELRAALSTPPAEAKTCAPCEDGECSIDAHRGEAPPAEAKTAEGVRSLAILAMTAIPLLLGSDDHDIRATASTLEALGTAVLGPSEDCQTFIQSRRVGVTACGRCGTPRNRHA